MISVIIPTRDRAEDLAQSLPSVLAIDYPDFEVIVVDQSTSDASERVIASLVSTLREDGSPWELVITDESASVTAGEALSGGGLSGGRRLIYRRTGTVGVSRNLNEGVRCARADIMAFTPDDSRVPQDWLRRAAAVLADEPQAGMVFGAVAAEQHDRHTFVPRFVPQGYRRLQGRLAYLHFHGVMGANMFIRRAVFHQLGGFDECLGTGCRFRSHEDVDFAYRALRAGFAVVLDPENAVVHWGGRDFSDGSAQRLIRNSRYGWGAFLAKHIRCGDLVAAYALLRGGFGALVSLLSNLAKRRTFTGAGRLGYMIMGVLAGFLQPVDHRRWLYISTGDDKR
jgi:GT2 family glycosyltransferase